MCMWENTHTYTQLYSQWYFLSTVCHDFFPVYFIKERNEEAALGDHYDSSGKGPQVDPGCWQGDSSC